MKKIPNPFLLSFASHIFLFFLVPQFGSAADSTQTNWITAFMGVEMGASFSRLEQQNILNEDLNRFSITTQRADSLRISKLPVDSTVSYRINSPRQLQKYDPVWVSFPLGLTAGVRLFKRFEVSVSSLIFLREQEAIYEIKDIDTVRLLPLDTLSGATGTHILKNGTRLLMLGVGLRYTLPLELLQLGENKTIGIFVQPYWNLSGSEFYTQSGQTGYRRESLPTSWDIGLGYEFKSWRRLVFRGNLLLNRVNLEMNQSWSSLSPGAAEGKQWQYQALKFNFQILYYLGS